MTGKTWKQFGRGEFRSFHSERGTASPCRQAHTGSMCRCCPARLQMATASQRGVGKSGTSAQRAGVSSCVSAYNASLAQKNYELKTLVFGFSNFKIIHSCINKPLFCAPKRSSSPHRAGARDRRPASQIPVALRLTPWQGRRGRRHRRRKRR